jgi:hypothetical protein
MTLTIARKREEFAVLASDGLLSNDPRDFAKIACHQSLPIACTVSGLLALPLPTHDPFREKYSIPADRSAPATTYIHEVLEDITRTADLTTEKIGEQLARKLVPFVNDQLYIACHVALVRNGKSDVGFMMVGMKAKWPPSPVDHGAWGWWPDGVRQWCGPRVVADLCDENLAQADTSPPQSPDELAAIMRTMVSKAITEEPKRTGGTRTIGGTAHLAKVTRDGAFPS